MFQDIGPHEYHNEYHNRKPTGADYLIAYQNGEVLLRRHGEGDALPTVRDIEGGYGEAPAKVVYLFSVDDKGFFLLGGGLPEREGFVYHAIQCFRTLEPAWLAFAGATACHLARWYESHRYCGRCATALEHKPDERALCCPSCGLVEYPKISPVIIVGIADGERLLLTRYAHAPYRRYALVAGFMEIGETLEDTVRREVLEEVGLRVKNIRYYQSQPWAFSESLLAGFFAEVDGDTQVRLDQRELSEATWFSREDLPPNESTMSLTASMIEAFREGRV